MSVVVSEISIRRKAPLSPELETIAAFPTDQAGNAEAVQYAFDGELAYNSSLGWLVWNNTYWESDFEKVKAMVISVLRARGAAADLVGDTVLKRASRADASNVAGTMDLLKTYVSKPIEFFSGNDDLLPVHNGTIDLKTGKLLPADSRYGFTWVSKVPYDENASYDEWAAFVRSSIEGGEEAYKALQMWAGYMLTGRTDDEKLLYLYGEPRAGKGTFTYVMSALLPHPISSGRNFSTFVANRDQDTNYFDMASLKDARMVFAGESERRHVLNAPLLKTATGRDPITAAYKGRDSFSYLPHFKIVLSSNWPVNADVDDDAFWTRIVPFKFPTSHFENEEKLKDKFTQTAYLQGVLKWAVEGAVMWYEAGRLYVPTSLKDDLKKQRANLDRVGDWLEQEADTSKPDVFTPTADLVYSYELWCKANAVEPKKHNAFATALAKKGMVAGKKYITLDGDSKPKQVRGYFGISLIEE